MFNDPELNSALLYLGILCAVILIIKVKRIGVNDDEL